MSFQERVSVLTQEVTSAKSVSASLAAQIDVLKMVPALFGVLISPDKIYVEDGDV